MGNATGADAGAPVNPIAAGWEPDRLASLGDSELFAHAAEIVSIPRRDPADSFVLHAPLELLARRALLRFCGPAERDQVRQRIVDLAVAFAESGERAPGTETPIDPRHAGGALLGALMSGDIATAWQATRSVASSGGVRGVVDLLAPLIIDRTSAAAHGAIGLHLLAAHGPNNRRSAALMSGLVYEIAREPELRVRWIDSVAASPDGGSSATDEVESDLFRTLGSRIEVAAPDNNFIAPTMAAVDSSEVAGRLVGPLTHQIDVAAGRRALLRVAAISMLQEGPEHAKYGWTHCLTMPQATLGLAAASNDRVRSVRIAATWVLGFRATLGAVELDPDWAPGHPGSTASLASLDEIPPAEVAGAVWFARPYELPAVRRQLASFAGAHHDAHLAKYTLACIEAASDDPEAERLFLSAAAHLASIWRT